VDVVYFVKRGDKNEELRYSLRSLANLPHGRVWIVGHVPRWVDNVEHIPGNRHSTKWRNVYDNLQLACEHGPDRFVVMNDDFFVMALMWRLPSLYRGTLDRHIASCRQSDWRRSLVATKAWLAGQGITSPLSYELHVPVVMDRARLGEVLDLAHTAGTLPQWRTLYGNYWQVPALMAPDCKVRTTRQEWTPGGPFISTDDGTWRSHPAGRAVREAFPDPSPYEVTSDERLRHRPRAGAR
jgi:hypothetical protein